MAGCHFHHQDPLFHFARGGIGFYCRRGLSKNCTGKSKSYAKPIDLGNTKFEEMVKGPKINKRCRKEIAGKLHKKSRCGVYAGSQSADQHMSEAVEEGEIVSSEDDDDQ